MTLDACGSSAAPATQSHVLGCYEGVARATRRMLDAARAGDWDAMDVGGRDCERWMQRIEAVPGCAALLDTEGRRRRMQILQQVLRDDADLRDLLEPWLGQVARCLGRPAAPSA